ncbi:mucin-12-like [Pseudophryne corroboree]|uniref:mucin-12-like n=1 Tax=Pseudophryne corroboree TaxID=495146 RepID=UPI003081C193
MEGPSCENIEDKVSIGKAANTTMLVELTVTNYNYTAELGNSASEQYKEFETQFQEKMNSVLSSNISAVKILALRDSGTNGVSVKQELLMVITYTNISIITQYEERYWKVVELLKADPCETDSLCISSQSVSPTMIRPLSEKETCATKIIPTFIQFFDPVPATDGLYCMSSCEPKSPQFYDCTVGRCQVQESGPLCFCPRSDLYIYTYSRCRGAVLIVAVYGSVGAAIAVLIIILVILGVYIYRRKYYY